MFITPRTTNPTQADSGGIGGATPDGVGSDCQSADFNGDGVTDLVAGAIQFFVGQRYDLHAWVVMPNHAHVVVWPHPGHTLSDILHSWKSYTSKEANKLLHREGGTFWQGESFNHWIRDDDERVRLVAYTENNPVKARLCKAPEDWKWSSAYERSQAL